MPEPDKPKSLKFTLLAPPFSINRAHYRSGHRTKECREWGERIHRQLLEPSLQAQILDFREFLVPPTPLHIHIVFNLPEDVFYTQKGDISSRSMDLSNVEKMLIDLLFDKRFEGRALEGQEVRNLNYNDKYITRLLSEKKPSDNFRIDVKINLE